MTRYASPSLDEPAGRLQYSLRSLLLVTTFCCVALSLLQCVSFPPWGLGMLAVLAWSGLVAGQGGAALAAAAGYRRRERQDDVWLPIRRRWAVFLAALGAAAPVATLDVDQLGGRFNPIHGSTESGWRDAWQGVWMALVVLNPASALLNAISCSCYFRPWHDLPLLLVRVFGLLNSLTATFVTLALCAQA
jgi:hypothetical protein